MTNEPVENITWPGGHAPHGRYVVEVDNYKSRTATQVPFKVFITLDNMTQASGGGVCWFSHACPVGDDAMFTVGSR